MTAPSFASLLGDLITLNFSDILRSSNPSPLRFRVTVDGVPKAVLSTSVSSSEATVFLTIEESPDPGSSIEINYTDLGGDQTTGVIELEDGTDVPSFSISVNNDTTDDAPPQLDTANVTGNILELGFNEVLAAGIPPASAFSVLVNDRSVAVSNVSIVGSQVVLSLGRPVVFGDEVTIGYRDLDGNQTSTVIQDDAGNDVATFSREPVVNNSVDLTPLAFLGATVNGRTLEVNFDKELSDTTPSPRTFRVEADGQLVSVQRAEVLPVDRQVVLTLAEAVTNQQKVTVSYVDPAGDQRTGVVEDNQGNDLIGFSKRAVQNDTRDTNPLSLTAADVVDGKEIQLDFSKPLGTSEPSISRFKVLVNGKLRKIGSVDMSPDDGRVILNLTKAVAAKDSVSLAYSDPAGDQSAGIIQDQGGSDLPGFSISATNFTTDEVAPVVVDAEVRSDNLILYFSKELDSGSVPRNSAFKVTAGGQRVRVTDVELRPNETVVGLTLSRPVSEREDVLISYRDPLNDQANGVVQDGEGNDLETFRDLIVENVKSFSPTPSPIVFAAFPDAGELSALAAPANTLC